MNILLIYYNHLAINYNKLLIIEAFRRNKDLLNSHDINIEFKIINNIDEFIDTFKIENYKNYIFWLHQKVGSYIVTIPNKLKLIKENNKKTIFWMDDLHFPCINSTDEDRLESNTIDKDERYKNVDLIVTPSIDYFINIKSNLINKSRFLFYFFDEKFIDLYNPKVNFELRINKIILSGKINILSYPSRKQMYTNYFNNKNLYDWLEHPGYKKLKHNFYHKEYYDKLSDYKGAILGLGKYPINFLLAKVIEILGCGCIGFFEESSLYKKRLGLIEYIHYIPIKKDTQDSYNLNIINEEYMQLINSEKGKEIALNGYTYIKEKFNSKEYINQIMDILTDFVMK